VNEKITIEQCCCGYPNCRNYWLVGVGKCVQGSGFTKKEAQNIADFLNQKRAPTPTKDQQEIGEGKA
jgi:hypothetical protein